MNRFTQHAFDAEEIMTYLDGELGSRRASALASHMESCAECQRAAKDFRKLSSHMLNFEVEPAPESLNAAITSAVAAYDVKASGPAAKSASVRTGGFWVRVPRSYAWAAAAGLAVILAIALSSVRLLRVREPARFAAALPGSEQTLALSAPPPVAGLPAAKAKRKNEWGDPLAKVLDEKATREGDAVQRFAAENAPAVDQSDENGDARLIAPELQGPMIEQNVTLHIVPQNFDQASAQIERLAAAHGGYVANLSSTAETGSARDVNVELRIPAKQAPAFVDEARKLGKVVEETRTTEEVTAEYVDLQARLKAAKAAEQRLVELLGTRTGKLSDVLEVERELARVRSEIESMQGQTNVILHQVNYATVKVELSEEYHEQLQSHSTSTWTKIRNAAIDGYNNLEAAIVGVLVFALDYGLAILFWLALLFVPAWLIWRKIRRRRAQ